MSDIMSFISNSENIWDFLGHEIDWQDIYNHEGENIIYELISKNDIELEKLRLKKD